MTAATLTLADFLLARIAEDEQVAQAATAGPWEWEPPASHDWPQGDRSLVTAYVPEGKTLRVSVLEGWGYDSSGIDGREEDRVHIARFDPARVLAECEAKRRLIDFAFQEAAWADGEVGCCHTAEQIRAGTSRCVITPDSLDELRILAAVYADHPDYREEWRVTS